MKKSGPSFLKIHFPRILFLTVCLVLLVDTAVGQGMVLIPDVTRCEQMGERWNPASRLRVSAPDPEAFYLDFLKTGIFPDREIACSGSRRSDIVFRLDETMPAEAYSLQVSDMGVEIESASPAGFLYALQTLSQLLYTSSDGTMPGCRIYDAPRTRWRAFQLDSGRQYQRVETIKKYLGMMLSLKMNVFQWHLTEGLGWRVEIRKYPELAIEGSRVADGPEQQGYYTQDEIREIIRYAHDRNIMVVPEIDIPGHAEAALSVYPQYSCFNRKPEIPKTGFTSEIFCAGKDATIRFLEEVLDEVCDLFPAPYIHLGGDEAPKKNWDQCPDCQRRIAENGLADSHDLQRWLSYRLAEHVAAKGKKAILFCDVMARNGYPLADNVVIHWWNYVSRKDMPLKKALETNHEIICGTNRYCYLNFPVTPWSGYKENRTFDMQDAYERNPAYVDVHNPLILGMTASLWTDYNVQEYMIDRRLFPRLLVLCEQMWRSTPLEPFDVFCKRVDGLRPFFESRGFEFGPGLRRETAADYKWD